MSKVDELESDVQDLQHTVADLQRAFDAYKKKNERELRDLKYEVDRTKKLADDADRRARRASRD